ncbi:RES family NAD+ phosphorylase [Limoniibacter endophyticus]|uniref:RES domain-containing protein n=1 Tax=Limoniibacter endophyticus TaxID=1565040 RepID=A0A8J3DUL0_9HYPH|nr:RES domain-containing protein [Limoniibacter endophyticus]GHC78500.1 hypothetical protein GCM10010136_30580 [Limoniibacter endophyticus]
MKWQGIAYRAHDPRWSWAPLSGEGARLHGGRFNPKGRAALYLALTIEGMFLEMGHGFGHRLDPVTVVSYAIDMDGLVDLRTESARRDAGVTFDDMAASWMLDRAEGREPASWTIARRLIATGATGALVPSFANGGYGQMANLVLWNWSKGVEVIDPQRRLPQNPSSWE